MQFLPSPPSWVPKLAESLPGLLYWRVERKETETEDEVPGMRGPSPRGQWPRGKQCEEEEKENLESVARDHAFPSWA